MCVLGCPIGKQVLDKKIVWKVFKRIHKSTGGLAYRSLYKHTHLVYEPFIWYTAKHQNNVTIQHLDSYGESGFWSFKTREKAREYRNINLPRQGAVICKVMVHGEAVLHMGGYRSVSMCILKTEQ